MNKRWPIYLSIFVALILEVTPMPIGMNIFRPDWLLMVLIFWNTILPERVNIGIGFLAGILLDVLLGYSLGLHSLVFALVLYISSANHQRMKNYSIWQQTGVIGLLTAFYSLLVFWLQHSLTDAYFQFNYFWPVITTMLFWPWVFWVLYRAKQKVML